jgi:hypothetical protein
MAPWPAGEWALTGLSCPTCLLVLNLGVKRIRGRKSMYTRARAVAASHTHMLPLAGLRGGAVCRLSLLCLAALDLLSWSARLEVTAI